MIEFYANQTLEHKAVTGINEYNEPTYSTSNIKGRKEPGNKLIRNNEGEEVVSSALVLTETEVSVGDKIDGRLVLKVDEAAGLDGTIEFYEVYLT